MELEKRIAEYWKLKNKLERYWKRLLIESNNIALEQGLTVIVSNKRMRQGPNEIIVFENQEGLYDDELLRLSKDKFPSLYRRFYQGVERHGQILVDLEKELEELESYG